MDNLGVYVHSMPSSWQSALTASQQHTLDGTVHCLRVHNCVCSCNHAEMVNTPAPHDSDGETGLPKVVGASAIWAIP